MKIDIAKYINKIPPIFRNVFFLSAIAFLVWMLFLDDNNMMSQYRLYKELKEMEGKKEFFKKESFAATAEYNAIVDNPQYVERFAREKYWMKKDNEDLYIIVKTDKQ